MMFFCGEDIQANDERTDCHVKSAHLKATNSTHTRHTKLNFFDMSTGFGYVDRKKTKISTTFTCLKLSEVNLVHIKND